VDDDGDDDDDDDDDRVGIVPGKEREESDDASNRERKYLDGEGRRGEGGITKQGEGRSRGSQRGVIREAGNDVVVF
jgi:hypothetical protein